MIRRRRQDVKEGLDERLSAPTTCQEHTAERKARPRTAHTQPVCPRYETLAQHSPA